MAITFHVVDADEVHVGPLSFASADEAKEWAREHFGPDTLYGLIELGPNPIGSRKPEMFKTPKSN